MCCNALNVQTVMIRKDLFARMRLFCMKSTILPRTDASSIKVPVLNVMCAREFPDLSADLCLSRARCSFAELHRHFSSRRQTRLHQLKRWVQFYFKIQGTMINSLVKFLLLTALTTTTIGQTKAIEVSADVKFRSDSNLCGVGKPSLTLKTHSKIRCASRCVTSNGCRHFNYRPQTTTCELFQLAPACSISELSCSLYQVSLRVIIVIRIWAGFEVDCFHPAAFLKHRLNGAFPFKQNSSWPSKS